MYGLKAYSYDKMGDSLNAKKSFEEFFSKVNPDNIGPKDYATYGKVLLKFPGRKRRHEYILIKRLRWIRFLPIKLNMIK